ncbi:E4.3.1.19 [Lepeophtheirus salmonis]|uniref:L-serine ammonia-lyase n=1 Tax=Lepeophtheirus salmonis TaxID=72036 RepID=A0A7R8CNX7_LEPSM|nr:E4.3.1.19 [Lepeophtheirus salmonis]CAF2833924.1 E4.3.1.19 [Lepeophtheirus salmonis]
MEQIDPYCDPQNPRVVDFESISTAYFKIKDGIICSPCVKSHMLEYTGIDLYFKKDYMQKTGSFKDRGARYALIGLNEDNKTKGVITASNGNHALAISYQGDQLGIPVTVVMPKSAPIMKIENCKKYGAQVIIYGENIIESKDKAMQLSRKNGCIYIDGYDHPRVLAGAGTMGLEILEQTPDLEAVVVPIGGGGLIAGVAKAIKTLKPDVIIIGVEPERAQSFSNAMKYGKPVNTDCQTSLADGLVVSKVGVNSYVTAAPLIDKIVTVNEESIALSILRIVEIEKAIVEGAGAVGVAAILSGLLPELKGKRVVIPLCGGNIDSTIFGRCLERGLAADGRLVKFAINVRDRPGGVAELVDLLHEEGVTIKDILNDRVWVHNDVFSLEINVVVETRSRAHTKSMFDALKSRYDLSRNSTMQQSQLGEGHPTSIGIDSLQQYDDEGQSTMASIDNYSIKYIRKNSTFINTDFNSVGKIHYENNEDAYSESHKSHSSNPQLTNNEDLIRTPSYFGTESSDDFMSESKDFNEHSNQSIENDEKVGEIQYTYSPPGFTKEDKDNKASTSCVTKHYVKHDERITSRSSYKRLTEVYNSGAQETDDKSATGTIPPKSINKEAYTNLSKLRSLNVSELKDNSSAIEDGSIVMDKEVDTFNSYSTHTIPSSSTILDDNDDKIKCNKFLRWVEYSEDDDPSNESTQSGSSTTMGEIKYMFDRPLFGRQSNKTELTNVPENEENLRDHSVEDTSVEREDDENIPSYFKTTTSCNPHAAKKYPTFDNNPKNEESADCASRSISKAKVIDSESEVLVAYDDDKQE